MDRRRPNAARPRRRNVSAGAASDNDNRWKRAERRLHAVPDRAPAFDRRQDDAPRRTRHSLARRHAGSRR
ncbi:hypothetical protein BOS5A_10587 [Bosea sp. EC-HK365B]|nr:hypothetical protein BOSE21B_10490 [Bosea sp. 21B]CAD5266169.1 hypothetical protein BOSE7B_150648 [Bosea sp. 7B]VVT44784.1 hypothetical protein BOS5A_10587 [Bosea sp. EC-HK365B]